MELSSFDASKHLIEPLMYTTVLIWSHSKYFCNNPRMMHLFKLVHNFLIAQATHCLEPDSIFLGEIYDTLNKLQNVVTNLNEYKYETLFLLNILILTILLCVNSREIHSKYRWDLEKYIKPETEPQIWSFTPSEIFDSFDKFLERLDLIRDILETGFEFKRLEELQMGAINGRRINHAIQTVIFLFLTEK